MARITPTLENNRLFQILQQFPQGAALKDFPLDIPRRTLQNRLKALVEKGQITAKGERKARLYFLVSSDEEIRRKNFAFSPISLTILKQLEDERSKVEYNRNFLESYRPNATFYLPEETRERLNKIGKTDGNQPAGTYARQIFNRLLIDFSWNSSRLEGNTYSLLETERLIELNEIPEGKSAEETQMILNHKAAIEFIVESAEEMGINKQTVLNIHALLSDNLVGDPEDSGSIRTKPVGIKKSNYRPLNIPHLLEECFNQIITYAQNIQDPFEQAFFLMVHIPYLQPFIDVNKRVSRLVANIPLIQLNLSPLSFMDVSRDDYVKSLLAIYELNRIEPLRDLFVWAYEYSCTLYSKTRQVLGEPDLFKVKYNKEIKEAVAFVVREKMNKKAAVKAVKEKSVQLPKEDQFIFIEKVEIALRSLHSGNFAIYRLRPSEFEAWHKTWF